VVRRKSIRSVSRIEAARREAGLRQQDLADQVQVSRALIGFVEGGYLPAGPIRARLADVLGVHERELWPDHDERPPDQRRAPSKNPAGGRDNGEA
jgi:ribosome-binding protein aMBF1 (putative translation factor)